VVYAVKDRVTVFGRTGVRRAPVSCLSARYSLRAATGHIRIRIDTAQINVLNPIDGQLSLILVFPQVKLVAKLDILARVILS
jgi:hypothetical protein